MRSLIRGFDGFLRGRYGVFEFSDDPACLLRLQDSRTDHDLFLPQGSFPSGTRAVLLHLWNEHTPRLPDGGADLVYARRLRRDLIRSFQSVARYLQTAEAFRSAELIGGVTVLAPLGAADGGTSMLRGMGFSVLPYHNPLGRFGEFWENFYTWGLMWTFNPSSLRWQSLWRLKRSEFWTPFQDFIKRYGG